MYGGRPLGKSFYCFVYRVQLTLLTDVRFNDRWHTFTPTAAKGGQIAPIQTDG